MPRFLSALAYTLVLAIPAFAAPPNVVMIIGDDQAWTDYGFMGHPHIQTPHLDKLASESAGLHARLRAQQPVPGRASPR